MADSVTAEDPRYARMFDVQVEGADPTTGEVFGDLTPAMCALRDVAPVQQGALRDLLKLPPSRHGFQNSERPQYTLFSFKACDRALRENLLFSSEIYKESPGVGTMGKVILSMVGEEHRAYRAMVQPMFLRPKAMTWWRSNWIDEIVGSLLDRLMDRERADLNFELCARMPMHVVTRGIGMNGDDALTFREHLLKSFIAGHGVSMEERMASGAVVTRMLKELVTKRRQTLGDDVMSGLIAAKLPSPDGSLRDLTDEEIFSYCRLIMLAGGGTTWRQLGITIVSLLRDYKSWEACRKDRSLIEPAIEEGLRLLPTDPTFPRLVTEDVEIEGVMIPAGARVDMCFGAANRDPARWDNPDVFDIRRTPQNHLGFGMGPHRCLGMEVAKQEMVAALNGLMDRFPNMRLDPDAPAPKLMGGLEMRGMTAVPVVLH